MFTPHPPGDVYPIFEDLFATVMKKLFLAAVFSLLSVTIHAAVLYSQSPNAGSSGYYSARFTVNGNNTDEFVWDSFSVPTNALVREIQWRGARSGSTPVQFQISLNTSSLPGGTIWVVNSNANETATATPGVYDYRFTLPAGFALTGGQTYWLQVFATQNEWPTWTWSAATGGNGLHLAQVPAITGDYRYISTPGDVAFTLLNAATIPVTITVNALPAAGGTVTGGGTFVPGTNITVKAKPAAGRTFLNWTEAGVVVSTSTNFTFAADGNKTLSANFSGPNTGPYVISAVPNPSVYGNVGGAGTFNAGEVVDLDVTAADGVAFVGWTENGEPVNLPSAGGGLFQITSSTDRNLVANFSYPYNSIFTYGVVSPASSGSIVIGGTSGLSSGSYNGGTLITFTATPYGGYHFVYWKQGAGIGDLGGVPRIVSTNAVLKHMVCYGTTITANFQPDFPVLTLGVTPAASGSISGAGTYAHGSTVSLSATPAVGYAFVSWKSGNTVISTSPSETLTLTNHTSLTANFVATTRTITATVAPVAGGSVTGAGVVGNGATVTLTAIPTSGYAFTNWTLGGVSAGTNNPVTFTALANYSFVANFTVVPPSVSPPRLVMLLTDTNTVIITWPAANAGFVLQENPDFTTTNWSNATNVSSVVGTNYQVVVTPLSGSDFFRLKLP